MHGDKRKGGREGKKRRVNRRICREGLYNLSEGSRRKWLRVQLFEVPIHPGQFLEVSSRAGGGGETWGRPTRPSREGVKDVFSNRDRVNEVPLSKITPAIGRDSRGCPLGPGSGGERNPDHISSTRAYAVCALSRNYQFICRPWVRPRLKLGPDATGDRR